jgi:hypothetical protein
MQLQRDRMQNFLGRDAGICEVNGFDIRGQPRLHHAAQHRFTAADLAGDLDNAFALADRV